MYRGGRRKVLVLGHELWMILIDSIICEVLIKVIKVIFGGLLKFLSRKSG